MRGSAVMLAFAVLLPGLAMAQTEDPAPRAQVIRAVERGFFAEADVGLSVVVGDVGDLSVGPGPMLGAYLGYDILPILSFSVGGLAVAAFNTSDDPEASQSDLFYVGPMARLQLALLSSQRDFLSIRADGGLAFALPEELAGEPFGEPGPAVGGAVVYEHFSKLRHFSLGLSAGAMVYLEPATAVAIQVSPLVKYTF